MVLSIAIKPSQFNISHLFAPSFLVISFLKEFVLIYSHTTIAFVSTQLNGFNYWYLTQIILFDINRLFAHSEVVTTIAI